MAGSGFGTLFRVTTFGESHGAAVGAVIDGCPAGLTLSEADIQRYLDRRRPGQAASASQRREADQCRILSGVWEGRTLGTPIAALVENRDANAADYEALKHVYRPGHADYTYEQKYGIRDYRGGGRSSGRETVGRVIGGAVAAKVLSALGVTVHAWVSQIGALPQGEGDGGISRETEAYLHGLRQEGDSVGGVISCRISGVPAGIGEPVFDKLDAELSKAMMSIGAVKAIAFGAGFSAAEMRGSEYNKNAAHAGGVVGGISDGTALCFQVAVKPTPSIRRRQQALDWELRPVELAIGGRHDVVIAPRAAVVVESMACITLLDLMMRHGVSRMDQLKQQIRY